MHNDHRGTPDQLHNNWLATVINPGTISDPNTTNRLAYGRLSSHRLFDPSYEPAKFDYDRSLGEVAANTYGQPYLQSDFSQCRRAFSTDDDLPANPILLNLTNREGIPAESPVAAAQEPEVKKRTRGRNGGGKGGKGVAKEEEDKEGSEPCTQQCQSFNPAEDMAPACLYFAGYIEGIHKTDEFACCHPNTTVSQRPEEQ
ncbi:hypothetical protein B0H14DRAFT_2558251 [Mycena olivaceomarginata]|nr:hypothetical protein B0H14DRAFT_2558251 [Mycena olivaceomarginata]